MLRKLSCPLLPKPRGDANIFRPLAELPQSSRTEAWRGSTFRARFGNQLECTKPGPGRSCFIDGWTATIDGQLRAEQEFYERFRCRTSQRGFRAMGHVRRRGAERLHVPRRACERARRVGDSFRSAAANHRPRFERLLAGDACLPRSRSGALFGCRSRRIVDRASSRQCSDLARARGARLRKPGRRARRTGRWVG